jgi:hypothetical protein
LPRTPQRALGAKEGEARDQRVTRAADRASKKRYEKGLSRMTNKNPRRDRITAGAVGKVDATEITSPPLPDQAHRDADDLRVERIAAQLEEAEQQRLTDDWIKEQQHPDADAWQSAPISFLMDARHVVRIPALSQTAREVLESRRQSERRAPEAGASSPERTRPRSECCTARATRRTDPFS